MENVKHTKAACAQSLNAIEDALYVIGGKWKLRVIVALKEGPTRFNELQRTVRGISAKVLSNELKELEISGLIQRIVYTDGPVVIEYDLTPYCASLNNVLEALMEWGRGHREKLRSESGEPQFAETHAL